MPARPILAVIPAGGMGTRLWPRSRSKTPKHVLPLGNGGTPLLRETYDRAALLADQVFVLTEVAQQDLICQVLPELDSTHLILEPSARGTTNAYTLAALTLHARYPNAVMFAMPADHIVRGAASIKRSVRAAIRTATKFDSLVTVGLKPTFASTGLGYIHAPGSSKLGSLAVQSFVEKPDLLTANQFLASGSYYWNLAWFAWRLDFFLAQVGAYAPRHLNGMRRVLAARAAGDEAKVSRLYARLPIAVIDRSLMEKTTALRLVPATFEWADIGNWSELGDRVRADANQNSVEGEAILIDTHGSLILGQGRLIATIGLQNFIIIDTEDALLICPRSRAQDVKLVVEHLRKSGKTRYL